MIPFKSKIQKPIYSLIRDLKNSHQKTKPLKSTVIGKYSTYNAIHQGIEVEFENASLEIFFETAEIVRLTWQPGKLPLPYGISEEFIKTKQIPVKTNIIDTELNLSISSEKLQLFISAQGEIKYLDSQGSVIRIESPPKRFGNSWQHTSPIKEKQVFLGLGGSTAINTLRGGTYTLWNSDPGGSYQIGTNPINYHHPTFLSVSETGSFLIFYENSYKGTISIDDQKRDTTNQIYVEFDDGALRYYVIAGEFPQIYENYTKLTGRHELPPRWALGFHQSRWGYRTSNDIRDVLQGFKDNDLPLGAIHLDIDHMDDYRIFTHDPQRYSDFTELIDEIHQQNAKAVVIIDPAVKADKDFNVYQEGIKGNYFCKNKNGKTMHALVWPGRSAFPDFTNSKTRAWWGSLYHFYLNAKIDGFWHDMNEPTAFYSWGEASIDITTQHSMEERGGTHEEAHNLYGLLMNRAAYEGLKALAPKKRPWMLTRSGWAGAQRYTWNWTGDIDSTWKTLKLTISMIIHHAMSGMSYTGADVGGFSNHPSDELFLRWFQMSVFLPFFRVHSCWGLPHREVYVYDEPTLSYLRDSLKLRNKMMPYFYSLAYENHHTGIPLIRPIYWDSPKDSTLWKEEESFMLGDAFLISPILEENAKTKTVFLPKGHWYDFWTDELYQGGGQFKIEAHPEQIPVFIKAGSVFKLEEEDKTKILHIYPQIEGLGKGFYYDDIGDSYGTYHIERYRLHWEASQIILTKTKENTGYPVPDNFQIQCHGLKISRVWIDEQPKFLPIEDNFFQVDDFSRIRFEFEV